MATNNYEKLYANMKKRLTVIDSESEYTLGEYMTMKADKKKDAAVVPASNTTQLTRSENAVVNFISYINDKLTVKEPPVKDKTIRAFPFRASASALLSAVVACTFMLSFGIIGAKLINVQDKVSEPAVVEYVAENAPQEVEATADAVK